MNKLLSLYCILLYCFLISCNSKEDKIAKIVDSDSPKDDYILLDSLKINERETLYSFICSDFLSGGDKVYISVSDNVCNISKDKILVEGNSIGGFSDRNDNIIYLFGFEKPLVVDNFSRFQFEIRDLSDDKILTEYRKKNLKRVHQDKLCN